DATGAPSGASMPHVERNSRPEGRPVRAGSPRADPLRAVAESLPIIAWVAGPGGSAEFFNRLWYDVTGLTPDGSVGRGWRAAVHPAALPASGAGWRAARAAGSSSGVELGLGAAEGTYRPVRARAEPIRDDGGRIIHWFGTCTEADPNGRGLVEAA